jgi:hypothetical protein
MMVAIFIPDYNSGLFFAKALIFETRSYDRIKNKGWFLRGWSFGCSLGCGRLRARLFDLIGSQQIRVFDEAAEFFFADVMVRAFASGEIFEGLVLNLEPLEMEDQKILVAFVPDLALHKFHAFKLSAHEETGERFVLSEQAWRVADASPNQRIVTEIYRRA